MFKILFLCTGNSGRSQMAASFSKQIAPQNIEVFCAGDRHFNINKNAVITMQEIELEIPKKVEHTLDELQTEAFDLVITMCNNAREICPVFPGSPARIHWGLADPGKQRDNQASSKELFKEVRNDIRNRVIALFKYGFIESIREMRMIFGSLLNNLTDGVMAHDMQRRIFYFNKAAEQLTGYHHSELIGKDCHEVFVNKFCGGNCSFCDKQELSNSKLRYQRTFIDKNQQQRNLEMSVVSINPPNNRVIGAMIVFRDITEVTHLRKRLEQSRGFNGIIGRHISMVKVFESIRELADISVPILIMGETGTGKEMVATALHQLSSRSSGPFVPVNCGALPEGTLESELFGHVKGAFTGAVRDRKGRFELAEGGAIFLDEIGEVSHSMQVKLLRVIQEKSFVPVGGEKSIKVDARIICATNRDLKLLTQQGLFREDLYYRLAVVPINLPSLREKQSDISLLIEHFLDKYSIDIGKNVVDISSEALSILMKYNWPGNVRELSNAIQYGMIKCPKGSSTLETEHLPPEILEFENSLNKPKLGRPTNLNTEIVKDALDRTANNKAKAAKLLGISRTTLYRFLEKM